MFAPRHDDPPSLRQGDVIADVFFPLTKPGILRYLAMYKAGSGAEVKLEPVIEVPPGSKRRYLQAISHGAIGHGAVISQCCDLDRKHPKTSLSLCRLVPFERGKYRNENVLVDNIDPWGPENPYFQFFYYGEIDGLEGWYMADFGLLTSFGWSDYEIILAKKVHQLDDINRNKFRVKVGAFFGRPTAEDRAAGLANPFNVVPPIRKTFLTRLRSLVGMGSGS